MTAPAPDRFDGKVALVTGAGRGIGLTIARTLAERGAHVILGDIDASRGEAAQARIRSTGGRADFVSIDLAKPGAGADLVQRAAIIGGGLDILVNNARAGGRRGFADETEANWDRAQNVGTKAAFFATQAAAPLMQKRGGGAVVNVASVAGTQVTNEAPSYHATKAALLHLTRYLAVAAGEFGVRVNAVLPGLIVQDEHRERFERADNGPYRDLAAAYQPLGKVGSEADVAEAVAFLCSTRAAYVSGACLTLDGAATTQEPFGLLLRSRPKQEVAA